MERERYHPIAVAARRTGLSGHVIRAWEKRYGAVHPRRTEGNHRLYTDDDIERLIMLRRATETGRSIGQVAGLSTEELQHLIARDVDEPRVTTGEESGGDPERYVRMCLDAVMRLDSAALGDALLRSSIALGWIRVIEEVIAPLMRSLGERWSDGSLRILHEHMASAVVRTYLGDVLRSLEVSDEAPRAVSATLEGERHEIGALTAAVSAALEGWKVEYLGPNLPWEEIARAAEIFGARAVMISIILPAEENRAAADLLKLRSYLPDHVSLLAGGHLPESRREELMGKKIECFTDFRELRNRLSVLRPR
jgi:DNA-binding transcriptional MerR regulator/methylmalonyl-CoA mutase cobalamin-binding subunit